VSKRLEIGDEAPEFCLPDKDNRNICLKDFRGKWVVLYFYPKDNTRGCTAEALDFSNALDDFQKMDAEIIGISPDSADSHRKFASKNNLSIRLLSNPDREVIDKYGAWQPKKLYGREFWGVVRSTFLIGPTGKTFYIWRRVRVKGHAEEVKKRLKGGMDGSA